MYRIDIITIFPEVITPYLNTSILKRAQEQRRVRFAVHNLRDWAEGKHRQVDDNPYSGGPGMVMMVEPIFKALRALGAFEPKRSRAGKRQRRSTQARTRIILTSAKGKSFNQRDAERYAKRYERLVILCGRYEGVDERVAKYLVDEEVSVGPYVLTGGELPALTIADTVTRLLPGVLGNAASLRDESFAPSARSSRIGNRTSAIAHRTSLEYPHYTRPADFSPTRGVHWKVPRVLLTGDHTAIAAWRSRHRHAP